ncbi:pirin family protein [Marinomonas sp. C2222]|uniref:Pirin family protein n=1 Tax=Marinomonas sargassi TaxID=2984494 RepID=A0ABT2YTX7_9GAMM|nr:pirin family protein [Marinomonas sargassi]MCV2403220.1 pirin family protein [Marinomonas sargassi]
MKTREQLEHVYARSASDGDGVKLLRVFGGAAPERFDPFLLMDEFGSNRADDYIGGFPPHPHRGFSTITYMLQGKMEHRDHMGNVGLLNDGDVQYMVAGRGVIHSEMPKQTSGKMQGFQLWLNLPASKKMQPAHYQDIPHDTMAQYEFETASIKAVAGSTEVNGKAVQGYLSVEDTHILLLDVRLLAGGEIRFPVAQGHNLMAYLYEGEVSYSGSSDVVQQNTLTRFNTEGDLIISNKSDKESKVFVLAGLPIKEPIAQYGPYVMNTQAELSQAMRDYQNGVLTD